MISTFYTKLLKFIEHLNRWVENCKKKKEKKACCKSAYVIYKIAL